MKRQKLHSKEERDVSIHEGMASTITGGFSEQVKSKFKECEVLAYAKPLYYFKDGVYTIYWLGTTQYVGVKDPPGACWVCPVSPAHFSSMGVDLPKLVRDADLGVFNPIKLDKKSRTRLKSLTAKVESSSMKRSKPKLRRRL